MLQRPHLLTGFLLILLLSGCASEKNLVVLLADADGRVGQVVVSNAAGSQTLSEAGQGTVIRDATSAPQAPRKIDNAKIQKIFGAALSAQPEPPARFILYFQSGSTRLTRQSEALLQEIFQAIKTRESSDISVVGHTDTKGSKRHNLKLSTQRARAVAALMERQGVARDSIEVTSHGEGNPLVKTADDVSERRNRRVEVTIR